MTKPRNEIDMTTNQEKAMAVDPTVDIRQDTSRSRSRRRSSLTALAIGAVGALLATTTAASAAPRASAVTNSGSTSVAAYSTSYGYRGHAGLYGYGMAYDAALNRVMVADLWNYQVQSYDESGGTPSVLFRKTAPRGASGGIGSPFGLATDTAGNVYVADQSNSRVVKISPSGAWLMTIGYGGSPSLTPGCGGGHMTIPTHLAIDPTNGDIYVSDPRCGNIYVFDSTGAFVHQFTWSIGKTPIPRGIGIDSAGNVDVAEFNTKLIWQFTKSGTQLKSFAAPSPRPHDMNDVRGIAVDNVNNRVYAVGAEGNKVVVYGTDGSYITTWSNSSFNSIRFVTTDQVGDVYVSDLYGYVVHKFDSTGAAMSWATPPQPPPNGGWNQLNGIALDTSTGRLYGVDTFENRVQVFNTATAGGCPSKTSCAAWLEAFGQRGPLAPNSPNLDYPHEAAIGTNHDLWMDGQNVLIHWDISTTPPTFLGNLGIHGTGLSQFKDGPQGIQIAPYTSSSCAGGSPCSAIYTVDHGNCRIQIFDYSGDLLGFMGGCGKGTDQMTGPRSLSVDPATGHVYVADAGNNRVVEWDSYTKHIINILSGTVLGLKLNQPWGVSLDPTGTWLYVGDTLNKRVFRVAASNLAATSAVPVSTGSDIPGVGAFSGPQWMQFSADGKTLYITDNTQSIYAYTITG